MTVWAMVGKHIFIYILLCVCIYIYMFNIVVRTYITL